VDCDALLVASGSGLRRLFLAGRKGKRAPTAGWFGERDSRDFGASHACKLLYTFDNLHAHAWLIGDADRALANWRRTVGSTSSRTKIPMDPTCRISQRSEGSPALALDAPHKARPDFEARIPPRAGQSRRLSDAVR
jgi:hypothetical protein